MVLRGGATIGEHGGGCKSIVLAAIGGEDIKTKIKLSSLQINFFLRPMISATKILSPRPRMTPSEEAPGGGVSRFA